MLTSTTTKAIQHELCSKFRTSFYETPEFLKVGIAKNLIYDQARPINGLRHPQEGDSSGWYIWGGKNFSYADDFFLPVHISHLTEICPSVVRYLALPPGWRFLISEGYEDVWQDLSLLQIHV